MAKETSMTPMMQQYFAMKALHPEALLLFRCGDFYETYGEDAVTESRVLGITLTQRSSTMKDSVQMAGFPYHALETYLPKLVRAGFKVAICDQLEDPKLAKNIVKRGITELVTPGIVLSESILQQKENNFLAGLVFTDGAGTSTSRTASSRSGSPTDREVVGVAFVDVSTGEFLVAQGSREYVRSLIGSFEVREILVDRERRKDAVEMFSDRYCISTLPEWAFVEENSRQKLLRQFGSSSLKGFGIEIYKAGMIAAGALLTYLEQTEHTGLENIRGISRIDRDSFVWMDHFTVRNLELFPSDAGGGGVSFYDVMDSCRCPMGSRLLRSWISMPVMDIAELNSRYDSVQYFVENPSSLAGAQDCLARLGDMERILSRAAAGKILPREMLSLGRSLEQFAPLKEICRSSSCPALETLSGQISDVSGLKEYIARTIDPQCAAMLGKGPVIASGVNQELDQLRNISLNGRQYLEQLQEREIERTGIASLKVGFNNNFGYYLEVRNTYRDKVPPEWTRRQTLVGAERYITEELKEYENKILGAEDRIYQLEAQIYAEAVESIRKEIGSVQTGCRAVSRLDVLCNFAFLAVQRNYCRPVVDDSKDLEIRDARHPVIETLMAPGEEYVPNDLSMSSSDKQIMILTGPNMAGKSALLRQTALIVLMAQIGSFVSASSARIGWCDKIFTRVGASDNISRGESTFMVEMLETAQILHNLSARSLVLLDEIGRGTSTYDGMSIARAIVEFIHNGGKGAKTLFATHYHELNDMEGSFSRVHNFHIAVKEVGNDVVFLRKLSPGGVAHSFGIHVARMAGMPDQVVRSAQKTLSALEAGVPPESGMQMTLFQLDDPTLGAIRDALKDADINSMTPLQAFDLLRSLKEQLGL